MRGSVQSMRAFWLLAAAIALIASLALPPWLRAQDAPDAGDVPDPLDTAYTSGDDEEIDPDTKRQLPEVAAHRAFLPVAFDLTDRLARPGNQGKLPSCVGWAVAYTARSYYTSAFENRDINDPANLASPAFAYHSVRGPDCSRGTTFPKVVEVLK